MNKQKYFGTDGVRGKVGEFPITADFVMKLGFAAGWVFKQNCGSRRPSVLIGKDTRISGYMLESALEAGFSAAGIDSYLVGPVPTPAVAYLTRTLRMDVGVVISASHNPFYDNGIKFFNSDGVKLSNQLESQIENKLNEILNNANYMLCVASENLGKAQRLADARGRYIEFCKSTFRPKNINNKNNNLRNLKIVVDCANGAAYQIAPSVFHELGAEVISIADKPNGLNINENCGATNLTTLQVAVLQNQADLGIALDGDADRVQMVDKKGKVYDGDFLLYAIVESRRQHERIPGVVGTLMSNLALEQKILQMGIAFERANVGDRYVAEKLREKNWLYGGENSGHLLTLDLHSSGDGIIASLQVLSAMIEKNLTLEQLMAPLKLYPQILINKKMPSDKNYDYLQDKNLQQMQQKISQKLGDDGRILLRKSGTEPLLRIMVEGKNLELVRSCAEDLASAVSF